MKLIQFLKLSRSEDREYFNDLKVLYLHIGDEFSDQYNYCCDIDNNLLNSIADRLSECVFLEEFIFHYGFLGTTNEVDYQILFESLRHIPKLKKIDISFNRVGYLDDNGIKALSAFIATSNLEHINFNENDLNNLSYNNLDVLLNSLVACNSLQAVCLSNNSLHEVAEDGKFDLVCEFIRRKTKQLDHIEMLYDNIASDRKEKLDKAFQGKSNVAKFFSTPIAIPKSSSNQIIQSIPNTPPKCFL
jgi:hypothetical protein